MYRDPLAGPIGLIHIRDYISLLLEKDDALTDYDRILSDYMCFRIRRDDALVYSLEASAAAPEYFLGGASCFVDRYRSPGV